MKEPPRQAQLPGKDKITVPVQKQQSLEPPKIAKAEPNPVEFLNIPAKELAASKDSLPGAIEAPPGPPTSSQGSGSGGGAGTGTGSGIGPGTGSGLGPGTGGGTGGGAYRLGSGVTTPVLLREVRPQYTSDAMRAKIQGTVLVECVVKSDGTVGDVQVVRSLDSTFGLDQEAVKAARQWRFRAGTLKGEPVPVTITIELTFTLR
jgi:TonB family protein